jgi:hypothetical protein
MPRDRSRLMHNLCNLVAVATIFFGGIWLGSSITASQILRLETELHAGPRPYQPANSQWEYSAWTKDAGTDLRRRLAAYKVYDPYERWNRNIIQSWRTPITTSDGFFESWERHNPDFAHMLYNDTTEGERVAEISHYALTEVNRTYFDLLNKEVVLRSDFFRYVAIWADGGIWADVDTWAQRPFNEWIRLAQSEEERKSLEKLESKIGVIVGLECMTSDGGQWDSLAQYVFAAKQGHPIMLELVARIIEKAGDIANYLDTQELQNRDVLGMTGPGIFTEVVSEWIKSQWDGSFNLHRDWRSMANATVFGDVLVLPIWAFGSGVGFPNTFGWDDPRICAGHRFLGSWVMEGRW